MVMMPQNLNSFSTGNEHTNLPFSDRKTETINGYAFEEDQPESSSNEDSFDEVTMITVF